ncbi:MULTISPECIES: ABC transporter permease [unclassified Chelatococcus]|uniref:ABC transporter permease n=1 Tax=unclassified Chelatococcus TaxID=2638111 RepID=UPI001BD06BCC|nr:MULTISPECIES: ABC transporter permease [unclassified Chelatococcus]CAH1658528.1 Glutathione transport system permease protein GsiD [Hyphomicrobiales bacterium]MBS7742159.1 ABC transporter permease [Chelatococcus sp. HY11]MBX3542723.1 ABC transporter permease [Chelatococcus sp.]MCO5075061.1 ABC transporter permease [Chelatococcus sp.]CAH1689885.1 Glutathione transport system permease protein GsiD [Hyphomicrobiales bacterium]
MGRQRARLRHVKFALGALITTLFAAVAILSLAWTPAPPARMNILSKLKPPLTSGLLGTDHFGRDVASLLMAGAWNSLSIAMVAVAFGASAGVLTGLVAARQRGLAGSVLMRACDVIFAFPPVLSAMVLGVLMGAGATSAIVAIAVFMVPVFARLTRGVAMQVGALDYVLVARSIGRDEAGIMAAHVLPNIAGQIVVQVMIQLGFAILTEAGLSFLGLGLAPPAPTWGRMLAEAQTYLEVAPWLALVPGLAIATAVLGFSLLGDGLRDILDPRDKTS